MSKMKIFNYLGKPIRTLEHGGNTWWVLKDVCDVLELSDTNKTAERLDSDELTRTKLVSGGQEREMYIINESGLYHVILRSDKPQAKPFRKWVTSEVLPSIRKTGTYSFAANGQYPSCPEISKHMAGVASVANVARRVMKDQGCSSELIAKEVEEIFLIGGVPVVDGFVKPSYEQLLITTTTTTTTETQVSLFSEPSDEKEMRE